MIAQVAEEKISDEEFEKNRVTEAGHKLKSKEEFLYYKIFHEFFLSGQRKKRWNSAGVCNI